MRHVLCSVLEFEDETMSVLPLYRGTLEECRKVALLIPAVCNSTHKKIKSSFMGCPTEEEFDAAVQGSKADREEGDTDVEEVSM